MRRNRAQKLAAAGIPQFQGAIDGARGDALPVWAESHVQHTFTLAS